MPKMHGKPFLTDDRLKFVIPLEYVISNVITVVTAINFHHYRKCSSVFFLLLDHVELYLQNKYNRHTNYFLFFLRLAVKI